jgi:O-antigen ligase
MLIPTPSPLLLAGGASVLCWVPLVVRRLSATPGRELALTPALLGAAVFLPTAVVLTSSSARSAFAGSQTSTLSWLFLAIYLLGLAVIAAFWRPLGRISKSNRALGVITLAYWFVGALANYSNGFSYSRASFFLIPLLLIAAIGLRPYYENGVFLIALCCQAVCVASLALAVFKPSIAFTDPTRIASFLFSKRLAGVLEHANALGLFASVGLILSSQLRRGVRLIGVPVCAGTLVASDSRSAWFGTAAAIAILVAGRRSSRAGSTSSIAFRSLIGAALVALAALGISSYATQSGAPNNLDGRTGIWRFVLHNWAEKPLLGHGPGVWRSLISTGAVPPTVGQAHGQFFETLFTTGLLGIGLLVALLLVWTIKSIRAAKAGYWLPLALQALILAYGMLESPFTPWGASPGIWLLSLALFLDPVHDAVRRVHRQPVVDAPRMRVGLGVQAGGK